MANNPTRENILQTWRKFIEANTSNAIGPDKVIFAEEVTGSQGPRPKKPFITIKLISGPTSKPSFDNLRFKEEKVAPESPIWEIGGQRQRVVSLQAFGVDSEDELASIQNHLDAPEAVEFFKTEVDVAIVNKGTILDISEIIEAGFERRHSLDITFNHASNVESKAGAIEKTSISGKIVDVDGSEIIVEEFEQDGVTPP